MTDYILKAYRIDIETRTNAEGDLATKAKPGLLIVYHGWIFWWPDLASSSNRPVVLTTGELHSSPDVLQRELGSRYSGRFLIGRDLDVY